MVDLPLMRLVQLEEDAMSGEQSSSEVGVLTQRVSSLETGQKDIVTELRSIGSQLAERGRTPWALVVSVIGTGVLVIGAVAGLAFRPLADGQSRLELSLTAVAARVEQVDRAAHDGFVGKGEFAYILGAVKDRRDDAQRVTEERFKRAEADIDALQKAVVPRGEIDERWNSQRAHDADMQRQLDEQRSRGEALYGPRDELTRLSREVDEIRGRPSRSAP